MQEPTIKFTSSKGCIAEDSSPASKDLPHQAPVEGPEQYGLDPDLFRSDGCFRKSNVSSSATTKRTMPMPEECNPRNSFPETSSVPMDKSCSVDKDVVFQKIFDMYRKERTNTSQQLAWVPWRFVQSVVGRFCPVYSFIDYMPVLEALKKEFFRHPDEIIQGRNTTEQDGYIGLVERNRLEERKESQNVLPNACATTRTDCVLREKMQNENSVRQVNPSGNDGNQSFSTPKRPFDTVCSPVYEVSVAPKNKRLKSSTQESTGCLEHHNQGARFLRGKMPPKVVNIADATALEHDVVNAITIRYACAREKHGRHLPKGLLRSIIEKTKNDFDAEHLIVLPTTIMNHFRFKRCVFLSGEEPPSFHAIEEPLKNELAEIFGRSGTVISTAEGLDIANAILKKEGLDYEIAKLKLSGDKWDVNTDGTNKSDGRLLGICWWYSFLWRNGLFDILLLS